MLKNKGFLLIIIFVSSMFLFIGCPKKGPEPLAPSDDSSGIDNYSDDYPEKGMPDDIMSDFMQGYKDGTEKSEEALQEDPPVIVDNEEEVIENSDEEIQEDAINEEEEEEEEE
ncbi:MAG: hypothetical protein ABIA04_10295 [Pseudomonadota bacterium]